VGRLRRAGGWVWVILALLVLEGALGLYLLQVPGDGLAVRRIYTRVENVSDPVRFEARGPTDPPRALGDADVAFLRAWVAPLLTLAGNDLARVVRLRAQVHDAAPIGQELSVLPNPVPALREAALRGGRPAAVLCGTLARLLVASARVAGFEARVLHLRPRGAGPGSPWLDPNTGHYTAEVFVPSLGCWVIMDPLYNAHFTVSGTLAGGLAVHQALAGPSSRMQVRIQQGATQIRGLDATTLLPYFGHLAAVGDAAFLSGLQMLLRGERLRMVNWLAPGDPPLREWDATLEAVFGVAGVVLGLLLAASGVRAWRRGRGRGRMGCLA
jgi:hypothetical protein